MNLSKRQLDNKYVHRALTDMGAYKKNTRDLKRIFTDKSRKYKGNKMLKARYVDAFKTRCSALDSDTDDDDIPIYRTKCPVCRQRIDVIVKQF